jgi:HEPN domain-containing protein
MINFDGVRKRSIAEYINDNPQITNYVYCGPAFRYTQILLSKACEEAGKKLDCYAARLSYDNTIDKLGRYKNTTLYDKYTSLADAIRDAKKCVSDTTMLWSDQHVDYMIKYLNVPDMKVCWLTHGTGVLLSAMLKANPTTIFKCVDAHIHPGLNQTKYPDDYKRISTIPFTFNPMIKDSRYDNRLFHHAKKITSDEHLVIC